MRPKIYFYSLTPQDAGLDFWLAFYREKGRSHSGAEEKEKTSWLMSQAIKG